MDEYTVEVFSVPSNTSRLTISPTRVTLKVSEKYYARYSLEVWESIVYRLTNIIHTGTHRGNVLFNAFGFVVNILNENRKSRVCISYNEQQDTIDWKLYLWIKVKFYQQN